MKNFISGEKMKKKQFIILVLSAVIAFQTAGCARKNSTPKPKTEETGGTGSDIKKITLDEIRTQAKKLNVPYKNLDMSDTKIIIPQADEVYDLTFPTSTDPFERQVEKMEENIRKYEGIGKDQDLTQHMTVMYWDTRKNDRLTVPLNKATDQQKKEAQYLGYNDGKCSGLIVFSNFMLEMGDYSVPTKLTGDDTDYSNQEYGYRGNNLGTLVKKYDLARDDISGISYHLSDGDVSISDAIAYVEKHMKEDYYFVGSAILDYHVFGVSVRQLSEDTYYYEFDVSTSYKGIPLNRDDCTYSRSEEQEKNEDPLQPWPFGTNHLVTMFQKNRLGFIWSCCQNFESVKINDECQKLLPLDEACRLLSNYISENKSFQISSIELIYRTEFEYEDVEKKELGYIRSVHASPAYHFTVEKAGFVGYNGLYFDVDAVSGEVFAMYF